MGDLPADGHGAGSRQLKAHLPVKLRRRQVLGAGVQADGQTAGPLRLIQGKLHHLPANAAAGL